MIFLGFSLPPGGDWLWIGPNIALFAFWVWALIDCAVRERDKNNARIAWLFAIFIGYAAGALIYCLARRRRRVPHP